MRCVSIFEVQTNSQRAKSSGATSYAPSCSIFSRLRAIMAFTNCSGIMSIGNTRSYSPLTMNARSPPRIRASKSNCFLGQSMRCNFVKKRHEFENLLKRGIAQPRSSSASSPSAIAVTTFAKGERNDLSSAFKPVSTLPLITRMCSSRLRLPSVRLLTTVPLIVSTYAGCFTFGPATATLREKSSLPVFT